MNGLNQYLQNIIKGLSDEALFAIIFLPTKKEFGDVLVFDFSVTTDFIPSQYFLSFFGNNFDNTIFSILLF